MQPAPSTHKKLDIKYTLLASHGKIRIGQDRPDKSTIVYTHKRRKRLTTQLCYRPLTTERRNGRGREVMRLVWGGRGGGNKPVFTKLRLPSAEESPEQVGPDEERLG